MTVSYAVELVAMLASGLGYARWQMSASRRVGILSSQTWLSWSEDAASGFFAGVAIVGCLGLWSERLSKRDAGRPWGFGRLTWSIVGLYLGFRYVADFIYDLIYHLRHSLSIRTLIGNLPADLRNNLASGHLNVIPFVLLAIGVTRLGGARQDLPTADAREWAGRLFAILLISSGLALHAASAAGY